RDDVEPARREPRFLLEFREQQPRERRLARGLEHDRAASAGASLCATRLSGKLNGEIAPTTPIGRRKVKASLPSPACAASIGTISPASLRASTAANVYVDIARAASTPAAFSGFPASSEIVRAASS